MMQYMLDDVYALAKAYLLSRHDCHAFWPTVQGVRNKGAAAHRFAQMDATHVTEHMDAVLQTTVPETDALVSAVVGVRDKSDWFNIYKADEPVGKGKMEHTAVSMIGGDEAAFSTAQGKVSFFCVKVLNMQHISII